MEVKDCFDKLMKKQLQKMCGLEEDWLLEIRKIPITDAVDSVNFESVTLEKLKAIDKPIKLQKITMRHSGLTALELDFNSGLESARYQTISFDQQHNKYEMTLDSSKQIKKILTRVRSDGFITGFKFLDENDNEIAKLESDNYGDWKKQDMEIPDGFSIIGVYGNTKMNCMNP